MKTTILSAALVLMTAASASALEGYDGDNNRIPGYPVKASQTFSPAVHAQVPVGRAALQRAVFPKHEKRLFKRAQGLTD